ncbi:unnamed protein product [Rotaria sordida]|uniref:Uncharacterized protein n=2 Tax=Rotaria sordida TaxID=392033 RepID=A0A815BCT1_9BILA|nr:unnamed protein product [Rotaria sordida]
MWTFCHKIYKKNSAQLEHIDKLRKTYKACEAIKHYTGNSCLSRTVNQVCRTEDFQHIFKFRVYITDLHRQLDGYGSQQEQDGIKLLITEVYRGKPLSGSVLQQLIDNKDGLISMNGFLSTTLNSDVVGVYAGDEKIADGYRRAKFQLQISKKIRQPYAYIGNCSTKKDELEVLFSIGTIWRIESIKYDEDPCTIELTSCDELDSQLMELLEKYTGDGCTLLTLGDILWELGEDLEAEYFYQKMLEESTLSNELRGALHYRIGMIRFNRKDYSIALDNLKEVESLFESSNNELNKVGLFHPLYMSGNRPPFVTIYNNMGIMLENDGKCDDAIKYYKQALEEKGSSSELATVHNNLGLLYFHLSDYDEAQRHLAKAVQHITGNNELLQMEFEKNLDLVNNHFQYMLNKTE